ncbi:MAG: hypothetical protein AAF711_04985 [Planctomycetota bacterium]
MSSDLSRMSIRLEANDAQLNQELDQAERRAQRSGKKMEGDLSLGGAASGLVKIFAALGTIEAGFRSLTGASQLFAGDAEAALDSFERIPFGIGPAIAAAHDFFEVISGSREEAERLADEWGEVVNKIIEAQNEVDKLAADQADADKTPLDKSNDRTARLNELNREYTEFINKLSTMTAAPRLEGAIANQLEEIDVKAKTAAEAIEILREKVAKNFDVGSREVLEDREAALQRVADLERQIRIEQLESMGMRFDSDLEVKRIQTLADKEKALAKEMNEVERAAVEKLFDARMRRIEEEAQARRRMEQEESDPRDRARYQRRMREMRDAEREAMRERKASKAEAQQAERDRFIESKGFAAEEFLRTSFEGGTAAKMQEVKDEAAVGELQGLNAGVDTIIRRMRTLSATMT